MKIELIEEINPGNGTMYAVKADNYTIKWFAHLESAETFYNDIIANPDVLKHQKNILKSQEITLPLEETNQ
jgi:ribosomal protein L24E